MVSPVYENYVLKSGDGLSVPFIILWLLGDLTNLIGAVYAGLLPTMIILAVYVSTSSYLPSPPFGGPGSFLSCEIARDVVPAGLGRVGAPPRRPAAPRLASRLADYFALPPSPAPLRSGPR